MVLIDIYVIDIYGYIDSTEEHLYIRYKWYYGIIILYLFIKDTCKNSKSRWRSNMRYIEFVHTFFAIK